MPTRATSDGTHLRGLASGQHSSNETSQRKVGVSDTVSDLTGLKIEPQISHTDSDVINDLAKQKISLFFIFVAEILSSKREPCGPRSSPAVFR